MFQHQGLGTIILLATLCRGDEHVDQIMRSPIGAAKRGLRPKKEGGKNASNVQKSTKVPKTSKATPPPPPVVTPAPLVDDAYPSLSLQAPLATNAFNPIDAPLCVKLQNGSFDSASTISMEVNGIALTPAVVAGVACVVPFTFDDGVNQIVFNAMAMPIPLGEESGGPVEVSLSRSIVAGSSAITINLEDKTGVPFLVETRVTARLADNSFLTEQKTTSKFPAPVNTEAWSVGDACTNPFLYLSKSLAVATASVTFTNLPKRTITFEAEGPIGEFGTQGAVGGIDSSKTLTLYGFNEISSVDNKDFAGGTLDGWILPAQAGAAFVVEHDENVGPTNGGRRLGTVGTVDFDMVLTTVEGVPGTQKSSYTFRPSSNACYINVRYRFVTSEVPGGYYGSKFNDYYSVSIRSQNTEDQVSETRAMNSFSINEFNFETGSTDWRLSGLKVAPGLLVEDKVQIDLAVANVGDGELQSQVYTDYIEEVTDEKQCACASCERWAKKEIEKLKSWNWIKQLPACPCTIVPGVLPCTVRPLGSNSEGILNGVNWDTDLAMNPCIDLGFHPGAQACIRQAGVAAGGPSQQCCYDSTGNLILHGNPGAGTPDRNYPGHQEADVDTYSECCKLCPENCYRYIGKTNGEQGARSDPRSNTKLCP
jgi:AMOP domain